MEACPYDARAFNWTDPVRHVGFDYGDSNAPVRRKGVVEKCTLCNTRTDRGEQPICVLNCPMRARMFGDLDDPESEVAKSVHEKESYMLHAEAGTHPQVRYIR